MEIINLVEEVCFRSVTRACKACTGSTDPRFRSYEISPSPPPHLVERTKSIERAKEYSLLSFFHSMTNFKRLVEKSVCSNRETFSTDINHDLMIDRRLKSIFFFFFFLPSHREFIDLHESIFSTIATNCLPIIITFAVKIEFIDLRR